MLKVNTQQTSISRNFETLLYYSISLLFLFLNFDGRNELRVVLIFCIDGVILCHGRRRRGMQKWWSRRMLVGVVEDVVRACVVRACVIRDFLFFSFLGEGEGVWLVYIGRLNTIVAWIFRLTRSTPSALFVDWLCCWTATIYRTI